MSIKTRLRVVALYVHNEKIMEAQLEHAGEAIESELKELKDRIEELESSIRVWRERHNHFVRRIEALEELDLQSFKDWLQSLKPDPCAKEPVPTDKAGKPEGGLKPGDWLLGYGIGEPSLYVGEFSHASQDQNIWANWRDIGKIKREGMGTAQTRLPKNNVKFLFCPRKDQK